MRARFVSIAALGLSALVVAGCDLGSVGTPPPLTRAEMNHVIDCQHTIKTTAAFFMSTKIANLGKCADKILAIQLAFENGFINQAQYEARLARAREDCLKLFQIIGTASTTMADGITVHCQSVEEVILGGSYDPLQFIALGASSTFPTGPSFGSITSIEDIIGTVCFTGEIFVDFAVFYNVPRLVPLLDSAGLDLEDDIPLDNRCFNTL